MTITQHLINIVLACSIKKKNTRAPEGRAHLFHRDTLPLIWLCDDSPSHVLFEPSHMVTHPKNLVKSQKTKVQLERFRLLEQVEGRLSCHEPESAGKNLLYRQYLASMRGESNAEIKTRTF